jgi:predicted Rdx family selenoprotein
MPARHAIAIACCRLGGWGLHAGWKASRAQGVGSLPRRMRWAAFSRSIRGETIGSRVDRGRFAERRNINQSVRDRIVPACSLGHSMRLGTHGPQTHGPQTHGPQTHGPQMHGPQMHGPQMHGPQMHGPEIDEPRQIAQDR